MTAKFGAARRRAFLAALRETGNQTLAAERAKVSRSWVSQQRARDPDFRRAMDQAQEEARAALRALRDGPSTGSVPPQDERGPVIGSAAPQGERGCEPPSGWGFLDGVELVVRGTGGSGGGKRVQVARARVKQWSPRVEARFLAALSATCNVKAALAEVGMSAASAYNHRQRWLGFAERWDAAIAEGYARLEAGLIAHSINVFSGEADAPAELAIAAPITVAQAIHLLHMHKHRVHGEGKAPGRHWRRPPTLDEVRPGIVRKLNMLLASQDVAEDQRAADEAEWARRRERG